MGGIIDEAMKSRIHLSLRYPRIDRKANLDIWSKLLQSIERENASREIKIVFDKDEILKFAQNNYEKQVASESTWNERQIRNAFKTVIALGDHDRLERIGKTVGESGKSRKRTHQIKLRVSHFETIAKSGSRFHRYKPRLPREDLEGGNILPGRALYPSYAAPQSMGRSHIPDYEGGNTLSGQALYPSYPAPQSIARSHIPDYELEGGNTLTGQAWHPSYPAPQSMARSHIPDNRPRQDLYGGIYSSTRSTGLPATFVETSGSESSTRRAKGLYETDFKDETGSKGDLDSEEDYN